MIQSVSEFPASAPEQIDHFATLLSRSPQRRKVFWEIYRGKTKRAKQATEIAGRVALSAKRVLEIASPLADNHLFEKTKRDGLTAYLKYPAINTVKHKIIRLARNKAKLAAHVTVRKPKLSFSQVTVKFDSKSPKVFVDARHITVDDIDNFSKVRGVKHAKAPQKLDPARLPEKIFKYGLANILGNRGVFTDWGGEKNDLYTSHLKIKGKRYAASIGLKGPATKGILTPRKMGKNGDQIQRLYESEAQVFIVQYEGAIAESVSQQLRALAVNKSLQDRRVVFYGHIGLEDSHRLRIKYAKEFQKASKKGK